MTRGEEEEFQAMSEDERQTELEMTFGIPDKMFFRIRDVSRIVGVKPHVLRYWESEFPSLKPKKNRNGQRIYNRKDVDHALEIRRLLHDEKYSIAGARLALKKKKKRKKAPAVIGEGIDPALVKDIRDQLADLVAVIENSP